MKPLNHAERATILAALQDYFDRGHGDPTFRPNKLHEIACGGTINHEVISLNDAAVKKLILKIEKG